MKVALGGGFPVEEERAVLGKGGVDGRAELRGGGGGQQHQPRHGLSRFQPPGNEILGHHSAHAMANHHAGGHYLAGHGGHVVPIIRQSQAGAKGLFLHRVRIGMIAQG